MRFMRGFMRAAERETRRNLKQRQEDPITALDQRYRRQRWWAVAVVGLPFVALIAVCVLAVRFL